MKIRTFILVASLGLAGCVGTIIEGQMGLMQSAVKESFELSFQSLYLMCYRCDKKAWPRTFGEIATYEPSTEKCIQFKKTLEESIGVNVFSSNPDVKVNASFNEIKQVDDRIKAELSKVDGVPEIFTVIFPRSYGAQCT